MNFMDDMVCRVSQSRTYFERGNNKTWYMLIHVPVGIRIF